MVVLGGNVIVVDIYGDLQPYGSWKQMLDYVLFIDMCTCDVELYAYVYVHIYVYVYVYIYKNTYIHTYVYTYVCICIYV